MKAYEILTTIENGLSPRAQEYWDGWHDGGRNEALVLSQREGLDAAIQLVEGLAAPIEDNDSVLLPRHDFDTGKTRVPMCPVNPDEDTEGACEGCGHKDQYPCSTRRTKRL